MAESTPTLPAELPVLPLRRTVAFPLTLQPLAVNRPVSVETVNRALAEVAALAARLRDLRRLTAGELTDLGDDDAYASAWR